MRTIWKYQLDVCDNQFLEMPKNAEMLTVQQQQGIEHLWAIVDPELPKETRHIRMYGTGHNISDDNLNYISTIQLLDGNLVFHVFEVIQSS